MKLFDFFSLKSPSLGEVHPPSPLMESSALCVSYLHGHEKEKEPIGHGDHLRGEAHSPPLMDSSSSSCVSYLHHQEKNHDDGVSDISSAAVVVPRDFFPLTPDLKGLLGTKEVGDTENFPAQPKRKYMASPTEVETSILGKKTKHNRTDKAKKVLASACDTEEDRLSGISTELGLLFDPYKVKKTLTQSDVGDLSRLLIGKDFARSHLIRWMSKETESQVMSFKGANVIVRDADTCSEHRLVFKYWVTSKSYNFQGGWSKEFVKRRGLEVGDEVGIYWDTIASKLYFSLLHKAN